MLKRIMIFIGLILSLGKTEAQVSGATPAVLEQFSKSKTYIVLESKMFSQYNIKLKECIPQVWSVTPYEFVEATEFDKLRRKPENSFIVKNFVLRKGDKSNTLYDFITVVQGNSKSTGLVDMPEMASFPLCYHDDDNSDNYITKLPLILKGLQSHIDFITKNPSMETKDVERYYKNHPSSLKGKTLYIISDDLEPKMRDIKKVKAILNIPVKFVKLEDIDKAIEEKNPDVVFLHKVGPGKSTRKAFVWKIIMGASDGKIYFMDNHKIGLFKKDGMRKADLRKIVLN